MGIKNTKPLIVTAIVLVVIVAFIVYQNQKDAAPVQSKNNKVVVIAYQTGVDPTKVAQANGDYERDSHQAIQWRKFDAGSDVV
ncbi:MAG: taurine ABC transporter substrate-binding protein, partial [Acinetobacter sp.]